MQTKSKIMLILSQKGLYNKLPITDLLNIPPEYKKKLTNKIISYYPKTEKLDASYTKVTNVKCLTKLKVLYRA